MSSRQRQYQPRAAHATQSAIIAQRMMPHRNNTSQSSLKQSSMQAGRGDSQQLTAAPASEQASTSTGSSSNTAAPQRPAGRSMLAKKPVEVPRLSEAEIPLPSPHDSINDFCILPSSGKKVLQSFVFVRVERSDVSLAKKIVLGPQLEWKRRFLRIICLAPGRERLEIYRTERRKGEHPAIKEIVHSFPLSSLEFVQQQQLSQDEQLQFELFDYDSKKITQEYVYGHIRMVLHFHHQSSPKEALKTFVMELCCTSSYERDQWVDFFVSYICKREREELLAYSPPAAPVVRMSLCPHDGVQRFTSYFLAGARNDESKLKAKESEGFGDEGLAPISKNERTTSALTWDVLVATTVLDRKKVKVACNSVGIFTILGLGEFATDSAEPDVSHPDVFYVKPQDPALAEVLGLYLNDDKMFQFRVLQEVKKFRQWLHQCFGLSREGEMRSFYSPDGQSWNRSKNRSADASSTDQNVSFASPLTPGMSPQSGDEGDGVPFFQTSLERSRTLTSETLRRVRSVVLQKRKLNSIAQRAISDPKSFVWGEMASLAFVEYCVIGSDPLPETRFAVRIVALDANDSRVFVLSPPPSSDIVMEFGLQDVVCITGYSDVYGDAGFTLHLYTYGIEVRIVPLRYEARKMWTVALRYFWASDRLLRDTSTEEADSKYLGGAAGLYLCQSNVSSIVHSSTLCGLCSEPKYGTPQCRVSGLQHVEYITHVSQARKECGTSISALPLRQVAVVRDPLDLVRRCRETLARAQDAFVRAREADSLPV